MADDHHGGSLMEKISDKLHGHSSSSSSSSDDEKEKEKIPSSAHYPPPEVVPETEKDSAPAPAVHSPSSSSSASDSSKSKKFRILNRQQPIHKVLGGGKPADVFLWRNKKTSAIVLGVATFVWFLFEVLEYNLLSLLCHFLIIMLALLFVWSKASKFIHRAPPRIPDVHISENTLLEFSAVVTFEINRALHVLRDTACGKNLKRFLQVIGGLWIVSVVGGWFNFLTLIYLMFVLLHTAPLFYEKYEDQVDAYAEKGMIELRKHYAVVNAMVLRSIPKEALKDKKLA